MRGGGRRWVPSGLSVALLTVSVGLVGNLATGLLSVAQPWWRPTVFAALGLLILGVIVQETARQRAERLHTAAAPDQDVASVRMFGAVPLRAWQWQPRPHEERALRDALGRRGRAALVALPGARGAGKSQLAADYARRCHADGYDLVAWINTESGPVPDLAALAAHLALPHAADLPPHEAAAAVRRWLEADGNARRLLVFDNVEDSDTLREHLPAAGSVKVLITTNRREVTTMAGIVPVEVGMFTPAQGTAFLARATGLDPAGDGDKLGELMGWLPLGLAQAAAFITRTRISYTDYLQQLHDQDLDQTLRRQAGADHPGVLQATRLSLAGLGRTDPHGDATRLLRVLSLLSPDGISRGLLAQTEAQLGLRGGLWAAAAALAEASLITYSSGSGSEERQVVVVHRLTALVVRHDAAQPPGTDQTTAIDTATQVLNALTDRFPLTQAALRRDDLDELTTHLDALHSHTTPSPLLLTQADWIARLLERAGDLSRASALHEQNLAGRERVLGTDHPETLASRNNLAYAYETAGRLEEATALYEQNLADSERVLGTDHPNTLTSRNNLAYAYNSAGRSEEATALHEQNLADRTRVLGTDHHNTLTSRDNLASAYETAGRLQKATALYEQNLAERHRVLGTDHPDTLISRNNLAGAYESAGRVKEAAALRARPRS